MPQIVQMFFVREFKYDWGEVRDDAIAYHTLALVPTGGIRCSSTV